MSDDQAARTARTVAKSEALGRWHETVAEMLYAAGEQTAPIEGGQMPDWLEIPAIIERGRADKAKKADREAAQWTLSIRIEYLEIARTLRDLDAANALKLAAMLIQVAGERHADTEMDLWRKVERAASYEPGSLTGKAGVKQRVFL